MAGVVFILQRKLIITLFNIPSFQGVPALSVLARLKAVHPVIDLKVTKATLHA